MKSSCLFEGLIQGSKEAAFHVLLILHLETLPKSTSQALSPHQIIIIIKKTQTSKQHWLSSFRAQIIPPADEILSGAGKGGCLSLLNKTDACG